jgi:hypothetical protein
MRGPAIRYREILHWGGLLSILFTSDTYAQQLDTLVEPRKTCCDEDSSTVDAFQTSESKCYTREATGLNAIASQAREVMAKSVKTR